MALADGVFVDAKDLRALKGNAFSGFSAIELVIDPFNGSGSHSCQTSHGGGGNAVVMKFRKVATKRLATLLIGQDGGNGRVKGFSAPGTEETGMLDLEVGWSAQNIEMANGTFYMPVYQRVRMLTSRARRPFLSR